MIDDIEYLLESLLASLSEVVSQPEVSRRPEVGENSSEKVGVSASVQTEPIPILPSIAVGLPRTELEDWLVSQIPILQACTRPQLDWLVARLSHLKCGCACTCGHGRTKLDTSCGLCSHEMSDPVILGCCGIKYCFACVYRRLEVNRTDGPRATCPHCTRVVREVKIVDLFEDPEIPTESLTSELADISYSVTAIIGCTRRSGGPGARYKVLWGDGSTSYEPLTNLQGCMDMVEEYRKKVRLERFRSDVIRSNMEELLRSEPEFSDEEILAPGQAPVEYVLMEDLPLDDDSDYEVSETGVYEVITIDD